MIVWLTLLILQLPSSGPPRDTTVGSIVKGRVLDSLTGAPVAGAIVEIHVAGGQPLKRVEAAASGEFQVEDVPRGAWLSITPSPLQATHIPRVVRPDGGTASAVVVHLEPALAVDGRVVDESGEPLASVQVIAEPLDAVAAPRVSREHFSDDRGLFRLFGLAAGRYRVCAVPARRRAASTYEKTCYPDDAVAFDLRHGSASLNLTISLRRSQPSPPPPPEVNEESRVSIRGRVLDEQGHVALSRALVWLEPVSGGQRSETLADERGRFEIRVPPGPYNLRATAGEFKTSHAPHVRELLVMAGDTFVDSEIRLPRAAALSGVVVKDRDTPLSDVLIDLIPHGTDTPVSFDHPPTTDDQGRFRVHGVPAGRYTVCAKPRTSREGTAGDWTYSRTCVPVPRNLQGSDFALSPIRLDRLGAYSISGRIIRSGGDIPARVSLSLSRTNDLQFRMTTLPVGEDGSFLAERLVPGIYNLTAYGNLEAMRRPSGQALQWAGTRVEIRDSDVTNVVLQLSEGDRLHGRVIIDDPGRGRSLRGIDVRAVSVGEGSRAPAAAPAETDDEGAFVLRGVFGTSVLRVGTPQGYAVRSIRYAGRDITDVPTSFDGDATATVEIVLSPSNAELSGLVLDDLGRPAEDAGVLYFPADPARWKAYDGGLRQQPIGGRYRIDKITGGDYLVIAVKGPRPGWTEKDYAALAPLAERVTLADGERRVLDLRVVALGR